MVSTMIWNDSCNMLAAVADSKVTVWYYPNVAFVDPDLVPKTLLQLDQKWANFHFDFDLYIMIFTTKYLLVFISIFSFSKANLERIFKLLILLAMFAQWEGGTEHSAAQGRFLVYKASLLHGISNELWNEFGVTYWCTFVYIILYLATNLSLGVS